MHGCLIALIVAACLAIPVLGILAAIALPAYHDYLSRAKVAQVLVEAAPLKPQVVDFITAHERCPVNGDEGFDDAERYRGTAHAAIAFGETDDGVCAIEITLQDERSEAIDGQRLWLEYDVGGGTWHCSSEAEDRYLPADCRG